MADRVAPRRSDIVSALTPRADRVQATAALMTLEARGLLTTFKQYAGPWVLAEVALEPRVRQLCCAGAPDDAGRKARAAESAAGPTLMPRLQTALDAVVELCGMEPRRYVVVLRGRSGSGRDTVVAALLSALDLRPIARTIHDLRRPGGDPLEPELSAGAAVWDARRWDPSAEDYDLGRGWLRRSSTVCVALLDRHHDAPDVDGRLTLTLDLDPQDRDECRSLWQAALRGSAAPKALIEAAGRRLGERNWAGLGLAARAVQIATAAEASRRPKRAAPVRTADELVSSVEAQLDALIQPSMLKGIRVERPAIALDAVVASPPIVRALELLVLMCRSHAGIESSGRAGVKALLSGPPGTGKTMAARALARSLGRPLFRVDLPSVVSRWVGETEKNLREAMSAGEVTGAVLLFDEGDSLLGKRGQVEKGSDRYANMEVSYLLQALDVYAGIAIVTTNQKQSIDTAFERRFDLFIDFPIPGRHERSRIWARELGAAASSLPGDYLDHIARRADLSGGSIAAAARLARVLARERGETTVSEEDLATAIHGEFLKTGMAVQASQWASLTDELKKKKPGGGAVRLPAQ